MLKTQFPDLAKWSLTMDAEWHISAAPYFLQFKKPAGTSRGVMRKKESWFISIRNKKTAQVFIGECGLLRSLSYDDRENYGLFLTDLCQRINTENKKDWSSYRKELLEWPSIEFALETVFQQMQFSSEEKFQLFSSDFLKAQKGIPINGLVWMSDLEDMMLQVQAKIEQGYNCIKIKIGALKWEDEFKLLQEIRNRFGPKLHIRVDANGGFSHCDAIYTLHQLAQVKVHSIEQPIRQGNAEKMRDLCRNSEVDVALDEELIGCITRDDKVKLLDQIDPQYIVLKPSFIGGYRGTQEWIELAEDREIGWWITSALESNIGLNAIAQWTACLNSDMAQGLGTGGLFTNNFPSPLVIKNTQLFYDPDQIWDVSLLETEQTSL